MPEFRMPSLGADMDQGTLTEWLVKPGDQVRKGDIVAVVETDKADIEVECFDDGVIGDLLVKPGVTVPVGAPLARLVPVGETRSPPPPPPPPTAARTEEPRAAQPQPPARTPARAPERPPPAPEHATPLVRRLAEERGIDLASVRGTGHGGRITREDVERTARQGQRLRASPLARRLATQHGVDLHDAHGTGAHGIIRADDVRKAVGKPTPPPAEAVPPAEERPPSRTKRDVGKDRQVAMRRATGRLMARSKREIPHYYLATTIDMSRATGWLRDRNRGLPVADRLLPAALLLKAGALAARQVPELNGFWVDDEFVPGEAVHLGIAIALRGGGLITPALRGADGLALDELMAALKDLVARARTGRLRGSELTDATITATNLGDQGVESVTGVIYPPQVALIGFGKVTERPWAVDGLLGVRPVVTATLAADHRATDGFTGARLLEAVDRLLQHPEEL